MAEDSGISKTQIWVAAITVIGGLLTAIVGNADKWMPHDDRTAGAMSAKAAASAQVQPVEQPPAAATVINLAGEWRSDDGSRFGFTQTGQAYEYTHTAPNGSFQSIGKGTITVRDLSHRFETQTGETGTCTARINAALTKISGSCLTQDGSWSFAIER